MQEKELYSLSRRGRLPEVQPYYIHYLLTKQTVARTKAAGGGQAVVGRWERSPTISENMKIQHAVRDCSAEERRAKCMTTQ